MALSSDLIERAVFIIGAPRSGTSWMQFMLGSHPRVATPQETDLFSRYLSPLWNTWNHDLNRPESLRVVGLISCFTQHEFEELLHEFVIAAYRNVQKQKPGASIVLEKAPAYSLHVPLIHRVLPDARFIHVLRDGRDVSASLRAASRGWGRTWAPGEVASAAAMWKEYVLAARQAQSYGNEYTEVKYEQLVEDGPREIRRIFDFVGVDIDLGSCVQIYKQNSYDSLVAQKGRNSSIVWAGEASQRYGDRVEEPEGFLRRGRAGDWRKTFDAKDRWWFDRVAGDLLIELGYDVPGWARINPIHEAKFRLAAGIRSRVSALRQQVKRAL